MNFRGLRGMSRLRDRVLELHGEEKWRDILALAEDADDEEARGLLWFWPSPDDLNWLKGLLARHELQGIASMGCGSGLLEWILLRHSGYGVIGTETDGSWWRSPYSPPMFLRDIIFVDETSKKLRIPKGYALFFCYFNNGKAFIDYLQDYEGRAIVVIGPRPGLDRTTDPLPYDEKFVNSGWKLREVRELDNNEDLAVLYTK